MRSILTMLAVSALALLVLACQESSAPTKTETAKINTNAGQTAPQTDEHGHEDGAQRISLADAKKEFDAGTAVFVDTRNDASFNQERIQGAINVPVELADARFKEIPTDKKIIAYCS